MKLVKKISILLFMNIIFVFGLELGNNKAQAQWDSKEDLSVNKGIDLEMVENNDRIEKTRLDIESAESDKENSSDRKVPLELPLQI